MAELEALQEDWVRALAVVAHPDDMEYGAAAAVARFTSHGKHVSYVMMTDGEAGTSDMAPAEVGPVRREEQLGGDMADTRTFLTPIPRRTEWCGVPIR